MCHARECGHPATTNVNFASLSRWLLDRLLSRTMTLERLVHGQHNLPGLIFRATSMTAEIEDSVVISDGQSGVILTPAGAHQKLLVKNLNLDMPPQPPPRITPSGKLARPAPTVTRSGARCAQFASAGLRKARASYFQAAARWRRRSKIFPARQLQ